MAYLAVLASTRPDVDGDRLRLDGFYALAEDGRILDGTILDQDSYVVGRYRRDDGTVADYNVPYIRSAANSRDVLVNALVANQVPTRIDQQLGKSLIEPATVLLPALMVLVVFVYLVFSRMGGEGLFGGASGARRIRAEDAQVSFADVAGQDEAVAELRELADFLSDTRRFAEVGARIPHGVLLFGPPGCGKTLIARALAGEAGAAFFSISGSDFVEMYVGVGAARVRRLFDDARASAPAIVFIDELDAVGRRRTGGGAPATGSNEEQTQALNQLLTELDGFSPAQGVIVVGATNRPDVLDTALLRPGRFDRAVGLSLPGERGRREILAVHARSKPMDDTADLDEIAHRAVGMTGADLAGLVNEAALLAARAHRRAISQDDLLTALGRIREAPERQRRLAVRDRRVGQHLLEHERVTFADVAGLDAAVEELLELREYLADPARFEEMGARVPHGYLIAGPPGAGKTLLARALAGETNAAFVAVAATEFVEALVGEGAARVRDLFAEARAVAPAIVFIDELDVIGVSQGPIVTDHSERAQTLNQLLVELDGFGPRSGVIVMAATSRPQTLDPALTRPGRFDRTVTLDLPDRSARRAILEVHARGKRLGADSDLDTLARVTRGFTGADLASLLNEAALLAGRRGRTEIDQALLEEAHDRTGRGIAGARALSDDDRRTVAYHEAGHGLVARALPGGRLLHKISIVSRGDVLGATWLPESDDQLLHRRSLLVERMAALLGGRVAETLVFGEASDGAANDLAQVTAIARRMVVQLGMSDTLGAINYDQGSGFSEETARVIDDETRRLVAEAEGLAREVLRRSRPELDAVAEALLDRETLSLDDLDAIAGPAPVLRS